MLDARYTDCYRVHVAPERSVGTVGFWCMDPRVVFEDLANSCLGVILASGTFRGPPSPESQSDYAGDHASRASWTVGLWHCVWYVVRSRVGTLSPMASFSAELGVSFPVMVEASHVIKPDKQLWIGCMATCPEGTPLLGTLGGRQVCRCTPCSRAPPASLVA